MRSNLEFLTILFSLVCTLLFSANLHAATFTVTNTIGNDSQSSPTPGSLRHAMKMANDTPGVDVIEFAIPGNGPHEIRPTVNLPVIIEAVVIDGYTQPGASEATSSAPASIKIIIHGGQFLAFVADGITLESDGSTIKGLSILGFTNVQGGGNAAIGINNASNNRIEGNYIGLDPTGQSWLPTCSGCPNENGNDFGVRIRGQSSHNIVGGSAIQARNVISGNLKSDIYLEGLIGAHPFENQIQGNYIGTDHHGSPIALHDSFGNGIEGAGDISTLIGGDYQTNGNLIAGRRFGVKIWGSLGGAAVIQGNDFVDNKTAIQLLSTENLVGGDSLQLSNTISAADTPPTMGIEIIPDSVNSPGNNLIQSNYIGLTRASRPTRSVPPQIGILVSSSHNTIGGAGVGNSISAESAAISLDQSNLNSFRPINNTFAENNISLTGLSSSAAGIDLENDGISYNDPGDADSGANQLQNYPEILSAVINSSNNTIGLKFNLASDRVSLVTVELFASRDCGRYGQRFIGSHTYNLKNTFSLVSKLSALVTAKSSMAIQGRVSPGEYLTATATVKGNTSEFSDCYQL